MHRGRGNRLPLAWLSNFALATVAFVRQGWSFLPDSKDGLTVAVLDRSVMIVLSNCRCIGVIKLRDLSIVRNIDG